MSRDARHLYTIGAFAKAHGIHKKTLMWYDEIGLFHPAVVGENGYRYYSFLQSATLGTILMLRELNMSIPDIQAWMAHRSVEDLDALMAEKAAELEKTMAHLQELQGALDRQRQALARLRRVDSEAMGLVTVEPQRLALLETSRTATLEEDVQTSQQAVTDHGLRRLYGIDYGAMIPVERLLQGDFWGYTAIFLRCPDAAAVPRQHIRPGGTYLRAYCRGYWEQVPAAYERMLDYAQEQGIVLTGHAYETVVNETVSTTPEEYLTQIDILVQESCGSQP